MDKLKDKVAQAPGAEPKAELTHAQVVDWAKKDLAVAISFLNAIHSDADMLSHVCHFILGRKQNHDAQQRIPKSGE